MQVRKFPALMPLTNGGFGKLTLAVMGKYSLGDNFSVLGGVKRSSVADATADIFKLSGATSAATVTGASETAIFRLVYLKKI